MDGQTQPSEEAVAAARKCLTILKGKDNHGSTVRVVQFAGYPVYHCTHFQDAQMTVDQIVDQIAPVFDAFARGELS